LRRRAGSSGWSKTAQDDQAGSRPPTAPAGARWRCSAGQVTPRPAA
jgi:hypothetical protein